MREISAVARPLQHASRSAIHIAGSSSRTYRLQRGLLRLPHCVIAFAFFIAGCAHVHSAGLVRAIAAQYSTPIEDDESASRNGFGRSASMGKCRPRTGGDDRLERHSFSALAPGLMLHLAGYARF